MNNLKKVKLFGRIIGVCGVLIIALLFIVEASLGLWTVKHQNKGGIIEYESEFDIFEWKSTHHRSYVFLLDNGDKILVSSNELTESISDIKNNEKLIFQYSKYKKIFGFGWHRGYAILSEDGSVIYQEKEESISDVKGSSIFFVVTGSIIILLVTLMMVDWLSIFEYLRKRRKNIKCKQRREKSK